MLRDGFTHAIENDEPCTCGSLIDRADKELLQFFLVELSPFRRVSELLLRHWLRLRLTRRDIFDRGHALVKFSMCLRIIGILLRCAPENLPCGVEVLAFARCVEY
jgi:hypothetical protein